MKEWPQKVKELEKRDEIARRAREIKVIKPVIINQPLTKKVKVYRSKFDLYKEKIIFLLKKGFSLPLIFKVIKVGSKGGLKNYIKTKKLKKEAELKTFRMIEVK